MNNTQRYDIRDNVGFDHIQSVMTMYINNPHTDQDILKLYLKQLSAHRIVLFNDRHIENAIKIQHEFNNHIALFPNGSNIIYILKIDGLAQHDIFYLLTTHETIKEMFDTLSQKYGVLRGTFKFGEVILQTSKPHAPEYGFSLSYSNKIKYEKNNGVFYAHAEENANIKMFYDKVCQKMCEENIHICDPENNVIDSNLLEKICSQIDSSMVFVCDITPMYVINDTIPLMNSNSSIELGYAIEKKNKKNILLLIDNKYKNNIPSLLKEFHYHVYENDNDEYVNTIVEQIKSMLNA